MDFSRAIYNSYKLIGLYPNCHISYLFKLRSAIEDIIYLLKFHGLFNNGVRTYGEYLLKGEALYEAFILVYISLLKFVAHC